MAATTQKRGGIEVDGLAESLRALKRLDGEYRKEAVQIFRDVATDVQKKSQSRIGKVGRYPTKTGMIGRSATGTGSGVKLRASAFPWAYSAEYGEAVANIPQSNHGTKKYPQHAFKRRTMGVFKPPTSSDMWTNTGGYMIQPTIRARMPWIQKKASTDMQELIVKALRSAGVPRG